MKFKHFLMFLFCLALASGQAFAGHGTQEDGAYEGEAGIINASTNLDSSVSGNVQTLAVSNAPTFSGDVTFNTTLFSNGRPGGASTMSSSSTYLSAAGIAYSVINKRVGGVGGLDETGRGSEMPDGTNGQVLSFWITALQGAGTWKLTSMGNGWNWNLITFDTVGDNVTMVYETGIKWFIQSNSGALITRNQLA